MERSVIRFFLLIVITIALSGCKVKITVPEGGKVEGYTLYGCGEGVTCTINVNHLWFYDEFRAIPNDDHKFMGWKKAEGFFCGGKGNPCELSTFNFADWGLESFLSDNEITFFLEPVFQPKYAGYKKRLNPQLVVNVLYEQVNYPVNGTNYRSWSEDVQSSVNPITNRTLEGKKYMGLFSPRGERGRYWYRYENGYCRMTRFEKNFTNTITLPAPYFLAGNVSDESEEFYWDIVFHEGAHSRINRWWLKRYLVLVNTLFERFRANTIYDVDSCGSAIFDKLEKFYETTINQSNNETEEFHSIDTGAFWGECEEPNRFMYTYCPAGMR